MNTSLSLSLSLHCYSGSQGREVAHLGVINNSRRDHRDYTEKTRTAAGRNHRAPVKNKNKKKRGGREREKQQAPALKQTSGCKRDNTTT